MKHPPPQAFGPGVTRIGDVMSHLTRYGFKSLARLARDAGVSRSAVSRLISGERNPSFLVVARITEALERELGHRIDPRELVAEYGRFPTRYACDLIGGCRGCLPESATDEYGDTKRAFEGVRPGQWVTSRYPRGYEVTEGKEDGAEH